MRVLIASTRGVGHFNPLRPFADACLRGGHEVLAAGPADLTGPVGEAGYEFWRFDDPPAEELAEVWARVPTLPREEAEQVVVGDIFGRLNTTASLPRLREAWEQWRPDVVLRDPSEYGSALAAELAGIPHTRVGFGLSVMEAFALQVAVPAIDPIRAGAGLPPDPGGERLRQTPYLTFCPASLEDPEGPGLPHTHRFSDPAWDERVAADRWAGGDAPFVYATFGSVAGGTPMAGAAFRAAMEALGDLPVRGLLTVGHVTDRDSLPAPPANVEIEAWVPQAEALANADAVISHGGSGSTLGALAAGLPMVVVPLFADQFLNAGRVAATGAGLVAEPEAGQIRDALSKVLEDDRLADAARALAKEMREQPSVDEAVRLLSGLS